MKKQQKIGVALTLIVALFGGLMLVNNLSQQAVATQNATLSTAYDQLMETRLAEEKKLEAQLLQGEEIMVPAVESEEETTLEDVAQSMAEAVETVETVSVTAPLPEAPAEAPMVEETALPTLGSGTFTVEQLVWWMQSESMASKTAIASLAQAESMAQGTEYDTYQRTFASTQGLKNFAATMNGLEEAATSLANQCLLADLQSQLTLSELEEYDFIVTLVSNRLAEKQTTKATLEGEDTALVDEDIAFLQEILSQCESRIAALNQTLEADKLQLESAKIQLNTAFGNDPTEDIVITGELVAVDYVAEDSATLVSQAQGLRNEVASGYYAILTAESTLTAMRYIYALDHPSLLEQTAILEEAKAQYLTIRNEIEGEILTRLSTIALYEEILAGLETQRSQLTLGSPQVYYPDDLADYQDMMDYATEAHRLELEIATATVQYNEAVLSLEHATANGITVAPI